MSRLHYLLFAALLTCVGPARAEHAEQLPRQGLGLRLARADALTEKPAAVKVRHVVRKDLKDRVVESENFRVVYDKNPAVMEKIARQAEIVRQHVHSLWFGDAPYEWDGRTAIYLFATRELYVKKTGQTDALAHAQTRVASGAVYRRTISLPLDVDDLFDVVLAHEVTHTVMANRFNGAMPRWADEGTASLSQAPASIKQLRHRLEVSRKKRELFDSEVLMHTDDPMHYGTLEYYAQGMSLVEFFVAQRGRRVFTRFIMDGTRKDFATSLKTHYKIDSYAELHRLWLAFAFPDSSPPRVDVRRGVIGL